MRFIHKHVITTGPFPTVIDLPEGARVMHVGAQVVAGLGDSGEIHKVIWVEVDTDKPVKPREFMIFATGSKVPDEWKHVGTLLDGPFVWHIYERDFVPAAKRTKAEMFKKVKR